MKNNSTKKKLNNKHLLHHLDPKNPIHQIIVFIIGVVIVLVIYKFLMGIFSDNHNHNNDKVLLVTAATAKSANVPHYFTALGSVTPTITVTVKTQVNGILLKTPFEDGQYVKTGDLLAEIDPREYQALVTQYEGQLARDQALLATAKLDLIRYETLIKQDSVSKQIYDTQKLLVQQYEGAVKLDQGQLDAARVNLTYCKIYSPVTGRVGIALVDPGNFVQTTDTTGIVVVNTLQPIDVEFTLPENQVPSVMAAINKKIPLNCEAYDRDQGKILAKGTLTAIDNQMDPTTGTVKLKANFPNKDNRLFANQFVNIKLQIDTLKNATIIPTAAIQNGSKGPYVFVVDKQNKVKLKSIVTGITQVDDTVITSGISPGEVVALEGADKLVNGSKAKIMVNHKASK